MRTHIGLLTLGFFCPVAAGCVSNAYVIPRSELARLAETPPPARGHRIHAIQDIGSRRDHEVEPPRSFSDEEPDGVNGDVQFQIVAGSDGRTRPVPRPAPGARITPTSANGGWRGSGGVTWSGGGGGGGGGGNIGDAAVVLAVIAVAVAAIVAVGLVASEGVRFDGYIALSPAQPVHLQQRDGGDVVVALGDLTPEAAEATLEAKVMDDEGFGLRRLDHVLDRRGATFKLDLGKTAFESATSTVGNLGPVAHIQVGYFFTPSFGMLATAALGGADDGLGAILTRHEFGLELQSLPLALGPLHAGGYANGGLAMATTTAGNGAAEYGTGFGGGALFELDLTGRMALMLRAGADLARFDDGWSPAATLTGGLAIY